jgi:hypothetical protein
MVDRRHFLALTASGPYALASSGAHGMSGPDALQSVALTLGAGLAADPTAVLLAQRTAISLSRASTKEAEALMRHLPAFVHTFNSATSQREQIWALKEGFALDVGLSKAVSEATSRGLLVPSSERFVEIIKPNVASFMQEASAEFHKVFNRQGAPLLKGQVFRGVKTAMGLRLEATAPALLGELLRQAGIPPGGPTQLIQGLALGANGAADGLKSFQSSVTLRAGQEVIRANERLKKAMAAPKSLAAREAASLDSQMQSLRGGASILFAALNMFGPQAGPVKDAINSAVNFAQCAVQIYKAVSLVAGAATGLGMLTAVSGLLNGAGGIGAFGGGDSGEAQAQERHKQVMAAISELRSTMVSEFSRVNAKLDYAIRQLDEVLNQLAQMRGEVRLILDRVAEADRRTEAMMLRSSLQIFRLQRNATQLDLENCKAPVALGLLSAERMAVCQAKDAVLSEQIVRPDWILGEGETVDELVARLKDALAVPGATQNTASGVSGLKWNAAGAVRPLLTDLKAPATKQVVGNPAFEPMLIELAHLHVALKVQQPKTFAATPRAISDQQVETLRATMNSHRSFIDSLRPRDALNISGHPLFAWLLDEFRDSSAAFVKQLRQCTERLGNERVDSPRWHGKKTVFIRQGGTDSKYQLLSPQDFGPSGVPDSLVASVLPRNPTDEVLTIFMNETRVTSRTDQYRFYLESDLTVIHADGVSYKTAYQWSLPRSNYQIGDADFAQRVRKDMLGTMRLFLKEENLINVLGPMRKTFDQVLSNLILQRQFSYVRELGIHFEREVIRSAPEFGGAKSYGRLDAAVRLERLGLAIRAVCQYGYGSLVDDSSDLLQLFFGGYGQRLPDKDLWSNWANTPTESPEVNGGITSGASSVEGMLGSVHALLSRAVQGVIFHGYSRGPDFPFEFAKASFDRTFPKA